MGRHALVLGGLVSMAYHEYHDRAIVSRHRGTCHFVGSDGNVFYRLLQLYSTAGKIPNSNDGVVAGCRNGGPI